MITDLSSAQVSELGPAADTLWAAEGLKLANGWERVEYRLINKAIIDNELYYVEVIAIPAAILIRLWKPGIILSSHIFYREGNQLKDCLAGLRAYPTHKVSLLSPDQVAAVIVSIFNPLLVEA